ncbi:MAG: PQQ-dependent sugar dehydrogenase [Gammaproteobacteria bacterium]|nr:PQQ-dependent sugar dehydrogenase [Gammaproteobacteria bacterium]
MRIRRVFQVTGIVVVVLVVIGVGIYFAIVSAINQDPFAPIYAENCAVCHGENMQGGAQGPALVGAPLVHGESVAELIQSISQGYPAKGMLGWSATMEESHVRSLAILIAEKRVDRQFTDFKMDKDLVVPTEPFETELATFRLETVATGIDPYPFSIAPLPGGQILVTEKKRGLSIIYPDGTRSDPIDGAPETSELGIKILGLDYGIGWHLDVAPHPDYATNGWIYLHHTDLCTGCEGVKDNLLPVSMNRLVRGRIREGKWVDQEVIWSVPETFYNLTPDIGAGGRIAFDPEGYVYLSIGIKGGYFEGIQDLGAPYGKIHRIHDDGTIPVDNPFLHIAGALPSIWTYGHRSPQGLEFDSKTGKLWGSEMGPRGGDEVNFLQPGKNYGWPLYSIGVDYDGTPVEYWKDLGIEFDLEDIEQPVVDLTPSPAVSSFIIYDGKAFPAWRDNFIVGSLKATELYRIEITDDKHMHTEILIKDLARIRDVETGPDGLVYLLLEHEAGSLIVRLVPESQ